MALPPRKAKCQWSECSAMSDLVGSHAFLSGIGCGLSATAGQGFTQSLIILKPLLRFHVVVIDKLKSLWRWSELDIAGLDARARAVARTWTSLNAATPNSISSRFRVPEIFGDLWETIRWFALSDHGRAT